jgi:1A family penicillin-binding protein
MIKRIFHELWIIFKKPLFALFIIWGILLVLIPLSTYLYFVRDLTSKENIITRKNSGIILLDRNNKPFFSFYEAKSKNFVSIAQIPEITKKAVISIEDKNFYQHNGFSIEGLARAIVANIEEERFSQGGSTITQQLVKNTLLSPEKSLLRKYQELVLALEVERRFSKDDILEMYLNTVYFGEGAFGIQDAAQAYFGKDAKNLTLAESALLAAILPAPSALSPLSGDAQRAFDRQELVLRLMEEQGYITRQERLAAEQEKIIFHPKHQDINEQAPHFALMVKDELIKRYGEQTIARSGFRVKTTIDIEKQKLAEKIVAKQIQRLKQNRATNGATIAINPKTGEILVLVGSHSWFDEVNGKINMVTSPRQPGSSFKPIVYAKAFEERAITPATLLEDKPITYPDGYKPKNYDGRYRGQILARFALANSLNIPSIHVLEKIGIPSALEMAKRMGITTLKNPSDYGLSLVLGSAEVPLIEMTSAFGVFANEGRLSTRTTILEIRDRKGKLIYSYTPSTKLILDPRIAFMISSILSDSIARAPTFGNALNISRPAAVKTGTTEDFKDALTIGYTPSLVIGVWVGNNDYTPMDSVAGSLGAAPIWRQLMENFLSGTPVERFLPPTNILRVMVCKENGLRAETATSSAYMEFFLPGTIPTKSCTDPLSIPTPTEIEVTPTPTPNKEPIPTVTPTPTPTEIPREEIRRRILEQLTHPPGQEKKNEDQILNP